ncbi:hypothetical protein GCM10017562_01630 [Streptomyces roseofulvus]|uniref:hypothetical protein n=1 Tax=Streptomyces roseofulvus TaxID=33902 RepID=UPI0031F8E28B
MSATPAGPAARVGRNYTKARTHPWVLGKLGDFVLWFGPYNTGQLVIAAVGVLVLIKTFGWWSGLGPFPPLGLGVLVWAARAQRIGGRAPMWVLYGLLRRALQPKTGRLGGRTARPPRARHLAGTVLIEHTAPAAEQLDAGKRPARAVGAEKEPASRPAACPERRRRRPNTRITGPVPAAPTPDTSPAGVLGGGAGPAPTPLQQMLHDRMKAKAESR